MCACVCVCVNQYLSKSHSDYQIIEKSMNTPLLLYTHILLLAIY